MTNEERKPTCLLNATDELRKLIIENPELPLLVFAGDDLSTDYSYTACYKIKAAIGEFLDCQQTINDEYCYADRDEFAEDFADAYYDEHENFKGTEKEWDALMEKRIKEYDPYWKPCIILYANN